MPEPLSPFRKLVIAEPGTIRIELRRKNKPSMWAVLDAADADLVSQYTWHPKEGAQTWYAGTTFRQDGRVVALTMHRILVDFDDDDVDHIDGDGLNNRRSNLRRATRGQNVFNRRKQPTLRGKPCSSRFKGVSRAGKSGWRAAIKANGHREHLGTFADEVEAARAYDRRAIELHGRFARLNFPSEATG